SSHYRRGARVKPTPFIIFCLFLLSTRALAVFAAADPPPDAQLDILRSSAEKGDPTAESQMGDMYWIGQRVPNDYTEAAKWYLRAANQGDHYAQLKLLGMYESGLGVKQDYSEAYLWKLLGKPQYIDEVPPGPEAHLSPEQLAMVEKRAAEWKPVTN